MPRKLFATKYREPKAPTHNTQTLPLDEGRTLHVCLSDECAYRAVVDWATNPFTTTEINDKTIAYNIAHRLLREVES